jgi:hypothetical protein
MNDDRDILLTISAKVDGVAAKVDRFDQLMRGSQDGSRPGIIERLGAIEYRFRVAAWAMGIIFISVVAMGFSWIQSILSKVSN